MTSTLNVPSPMSTSRLCCNLLTSSRAAPILPRSVVTSAFATIPTDNCQCDPRTRVNTTEQGTWIVKYACFSPCRKRIIVSCPSGLKTWSRNLKRWAINKCISFSACFQPLDAPFNLISAARTPHEPLRYPHPIGPSLGVKKRFL